MKDKKRFFGIQLISIFVITLLAANFSFAGMHGGMMDCDSSGRSHMEHRHMEGHSRVMNQGNMDHDMNHKNSEHEDTHRGNVDSEEIHRGNTDHGMHNDNDGSN
jgi:hypothetical protein